MKKKDSQKNTIRNIGKKWIFADDNSIQAILIYLNGIETFDTFLDNKFQFEINAVIHMTEFPNGLQIRLAKTFKSNKFGIPYQDIKKISTHSYSNYSIIKINTVNNDIFFLCKNENLNVFIRFIEKLGIKIQQSDKPTEIDDFIIRKIKSLFNSIFVDSQKKLKINKMISLLLGTFLLVLYILNRFSPIQVDSVELVATGSILNIALYFVIRIISTTLCVNISNTLNRNQLFWGFFGFVLPPISLIIIYFINGKEKRIDENN